VHELVVNSIKKCDYDIRKSLFSSIIVAGGTSLFTGFNERLHKSIQRLVSREINITLLAPKNRKFSCWIGGATVSSLKAFKKMWITKKDFEEEGSRILFERGL
jgi:centractin